MLKLAALVIRHRRPAAGQEAGAVDEENFRQPTALCRVEHPRHGRVAGVELVHRAYIKEEHVEHFWLPLLVLEGNPSYQIYLK